MKRKLALLLAGLISLTALAVPASAACWDPRDVIKKAKDPNDGTAIIVAHRGLWLDHGSNLPENSLDAYIAADRSCVPAIETDVRLTKDGVPVLMHDQRLGRSTYIPGLMGTIVFDPEKKDNQIELNPHISELNFYSSNGHSGAPLRDARLLKQPFKNAAFELGNVTGYPIETVQSFYDNYIQNRLSVVVFLEVKDKKAIPEVLRTLYSDGRDYNYGAEAGKKLYATELTVIKFNALMFITPQEYREALKTARAAANAPANMPDPIAFPIYASNSLQAVVDRLKGTGSGSNIDPYNESIKKWIDDEAIRIGVEINNKQQGGILQAAYDRAVQSRKTSIGTFNAVPDYLRSNPDADLNKALPSFYNPNATVKAKDAFHEGGSAQCCFELRDLLTTEWRGKKDTRDDRYDPEWMIGSNGKRPRFKLITTDDYQTIYTEIADKGGEMDKFKTSPIDSTLLSYRRPPDGEVTDAHRIVQFLRFDAVAERWKDGTIVRDKHRADSDVAMVSRNGSIMNAVVRDVAGVGARMDIYSSNDDGKSWSAEGSVNGAFRSSTKPTFAAYNSSLWMISLDQGYNVTSRKWYAEGWSGPEIARYNGADGKFVPLQASSTPVPVTFNGELYLFFRGRPTLSNPITTKHLYYVRLHYGVGRTAEWTAPAKVEGIEFNETDPAVIAHNGKIFVFTNGVPAGAVINMHLHCSVFDGKNWITNKVVPGAEILHSPTVTLRRSRITVYFKDKITGVLYFTHMKPNVCDPRDFSPLLPVGPTQIKMTGSPAALH